MKLLRLAAVLSLVLVGWAGSANADPDKDESGHGRWREHRYDRSYRYDRDDERPHWRGYGDDQDYRRPRGRAYGYYGDERRERRAFKQEYDDGRCKVERKWERSGEYKEEVKCRGGRRPYPAYGDRSYPAYGYRY